MKKTAKRCPAKSAMPIPTGARKVPAATMSALRARRPSCLLTLVLLHRQEQDRQTEPRRDESLDEDASNPVDPRCEGAGYVEGSGSEGIEDGGGSYGADELSDAVEDEPDRLRRIGFARSESYESKQVWKGTLMAPTMSSARDTLGLKAAPVCEAGYRSIKGCARGQTTTDRSVEDPCREEKAQTHRGRDEHQLLRPIE